MQAKKIKGKGINSVKVATQNTSVIYANVSVHRKMNGGMYRRWGAEILL